MKVLVVGSGGREHSLCYKLAQSADVSALYCAPGNAGIAMTASCVPIGATDIDGLTTFAVQEKIDLVVVGPEAALVASLADRLMAKDIAVFGPTAAAARLEGSKRFMKDICKKAGVPTAAYRCFTDPDAAKAYIAQQGVPIVIKADGLAAGKGVTVARNPDEAARAIDAALTEKIFGAAGEEIVIEEMLEGEEISFFALCDGTHAIPFGFAQDHKAVGEGDTGPNTGGMGAYSPAPRGTETLEARTMDGIVKPVLSAMSEAGTPFRGVLYAGLILTGSGPRLLEFNVRFGDPECQVLMMRLKSDLFPLLMAAATGDLSQAAIEWRDGTALTVVLASRGYPGAYETGSEIRGLDAVSGLAGVSVFHAGTAFDGDRIVATGGRVLNVTARGADVADAQRLAYEAVDMLDWPEGFCRRDIGWRAIAGN